MTLPLTPSQTVGPFFTLGLREVVPAEASRTVDSRAVRITGRVLDGAGDPVPDALVESWQADPDAFARCATDAGGCWTLRTPKPAALATPDGRIEAPHLDLSVFARGLLDRVVTRLYFPDEPHANAADPVLAALPPPAAATLVAIPAPDGVRFDIHLQGPHETVFFAV